MGKECNKGLDPFKLPVGQPGADGSDGIQGLSGSSFLSGSGVPANILGKDGDTYVDLSSSDLDVYTKAAGVWTDTTVNLKGLTGDDGAAGAAWFTTAGVPGAGLGNDGDFALDSTTGNIYQKIAGLWTFVVNIAGTTGPAGTSLFNGTGIPPGGLGNDGDSYIDLASSDIDLYTKTAGIWSDTTINLKGLPGTDGADGTNFLQGTGVPSNLDGNNGDTYFDNATCDVYFKAAGVWALTTNLKTPTGATDPSYLFNAAKITPQPIAGTNTTISGIEFSDDTSTGRFDYGNSWISNVWTADQALSDIQFNYILDFELVMGNASFTTTIEVFIKKNAVTIHTDTVNWAAGASPGETIILSGNTPLQSFVIGDTVSVELHTINSAVMNNFEGIIKEDSIFFNTQL